MTALAFQDSGRRLLGVVGGQSGAALQTWHTDPAHAVRRICESAGPGPTREQWERYLPGVEYDPPCTG